MPLTIAAVADIHSPRYIPLLVTSINKLKSRNLKPDLVVLAGDIVEKNSVAYVRIVLGIVNKLSNKQGVTPPIVGVFGNEEYPGYEYKYLSEYPQITWINDEHKVLNIGDIEVCIVGSRGALLKPTTWQQKHLPQVDSLYKARVEKIKELLKQCKKYKASILVTHYASSFATVEGENPDIYKFLGYPLIETLNEYEKPILAIHGHAHKAVRTYANVRGVPVYNVSLPALKSVAILDMVL
ncbi:MAG: metallophosphoesterase [Ignisphaera sp.]